MSSPREPGAGSGPAQWPGPRGRLPGGPREPEGDLPRATEAYRSSVPLRDVPAPPPVAPRRRRGLRAGRALSWVAVVSSAAVLATSSAGYALVHHYNGNISRLTGVLPGGTAHSVAAPDGAMNVLLVGSDSRGNLAAGQGVQGTGASFVSGQRSDTVILAHLYAGSDRATLVSFPRDSWVTIPGAYDQAGGKYVPEHKEKLNSAFSEGGPKLLIETIQQLTGVTIDHFMQIDFEGFKAMVDKLGGVDVCLSAPAHEHDSGINLSAGYHHVGGDVALAFVRQRKALPNGDLDRIKRQQVFLGAIVKKVTSAGTLLNPLKLNGFLDVATSSVQVDQGLTVSDLQTLALRLRGFSAGGVDFRTIPVSNINGSRKGINGYYESVVLLDPAKDQQLFTQLRQDVVPGTGARGPAPASPAAPLLVAPANVRVRVFNGSGTAGLARTASADLARVGFAIIDAPQTRGSGLTTTEVRYGSVKADSARTLAAALPGSRLVPDRTLTTTLEVVVGADYSGARAVTVGAASSASTPATAPRPTTSPTLVTAANDPCAP